MNRVFTCALTLLIISPGAARKKPLTPALETLVGTEREFAATSLREGIRASFMKYFADDGISLSPAPHLYKKTARKSPPPANPLARTLYWEPIFADIASSGDLGCTMGPSRYRDASKADTTVSYGFFFSVWKKGHDGAWKVAVDVGSGSTKIVEEYFGRSLETITHVSYHASRKRTSAASLRRELMALDRAFGKNAVRRGALEAYRSVLDPHVRALRDGLVPLSGKEDMLAYLVRGTAVRIPQPMDAGASKGGDFGYTYGSFSEKVGAKNPSGYYVRVWRRDGKGAWRIRCEVAEPAQ
ncbi:MAG TPA: hypothetical protein VL221_03570 [Bacteroidota bacterium]|nr:hypothetical protein [Bacteroidota bacterium]